MNEGGVSNKLIDNLHSPDLRILYEAQDLYLKYLICCQMWANIKYIIDLDFAQA